MKTYFQKCFDFANSLTPKDAVLLANVSAEESEFCRFNHAKVRQLGQVSQFSCQLRMIEEDRQSLAAVELSGDFNIDQARLKSLVEILRKQNDASEPDPYILYNQNVESTEQYQDHELPSAESVIHAVTEHAGDLDFVGILAVGRIAHGFANSLGQTNWYETKSFNLDWSLYHHGDKAVKCAYAGYEWNDQEFLKRLHAAKEQLAILAKDAKVLKPGDYKSYLSPAALSEVFDLLNWGAFSHKKVQTKQSSLLELAEGRQSLSPKFSLFENIGDSISPNFDDSGFIRPDSVTLIEEGKYVQSLVSARTAQEYKVKTTGAQESELPKSLDLRGGNLSESDVLKELSTGLYINNLWYLNYSDRQSCRFTGMTRFATLWVEDGEIVAPVDVMRFDDCFFDMFGSKLIDFTNDPHFLIGNMTYEKRETSSKRLPGALINDFRFTL